MPEGDTIWRTAAALRRRIGGKVVSDARPESIRRLKGRRVESVEPNGKHLVMQFEGGLALHSHMRMTGAWHLYRVGERWRQPERRATAVLSFDDVVAVCFAAPVMELVRDARQPVAHLGPDILVDPFELEEVIRRARRSEAPTLGELLLEQRVCAGIGNIYKCESLWGHRLDPWMRPSELDDDRLRRLYATARELMRRNLVTPIARQRHAVHGRGGRPCPRCGTPIRIKAQGHQARLTYFCPRCQGLTATSPAGSGRLDGHDK
ncbi:MAG TPA: DNA-formamidopyrimidine glycosylase family protein [Candidatus Dormibacteraeota bacterium]|nr:DNA-formamidopyrimidine glycosylase family protein [Candidatus Dormibacteraeota bacterium]